MAADEKYPVLKTDYLTIPIQMQWSQKKRAFSRFFAEFLKSSLFLNILKKKMTLTDFVFPILGTPKLSSYKCVKSPVSADTSTIGMVKVPKHCWNLHHSTFIILNDHYRVNWVGKRLTYWYEKSLDCLLTHWHKKYPALNRRSLTISIQIQLPEQQKTFPQFFFSFFEV